MAHPQLENGHTRIANEVLEHLIKTHLSPNQWQVLLCIIRKTYGFNKKVDYIANFQIVEATGLGKEVVSRCLKGLTDMNLLNRNKKHIGIQKDWELWKLAIPSTIGTKLAEQSTNEKLAISSTELAISSTELAISSTKVSSPHVTQKTKETIQKKLYKRNYGEFDNILLTDEEYQKLLDRFGQTLTLQHIENLSLGIASKDYKYKSHYATILNWARRDGGRSNGKYKRNFGERESQDADNRPPEVFKDKRVQERIDAAQRRNTPDRIRLGLPPLPESLTGPDSEDS